MVDTPRLPIPESQLHYADPAVNDEAQRERIVPHVDRVHYPTLGCPALLTPDRPLVVLLSLPAGEDAAGVSLSLIDRHGGGGAAPLRFAGAPASLGQGPAGQHGQRALWRVECDLAGHPARLYDIRLASGGSEEIQRNAVRIHEAITGKEKVLFCGDPQFHLYNEVCLARFVERVNRLDDIAWIAMIGDVCDNCVRGASNILLLAARAKPCPVTCYYTEEFPKAAEILARLNKPVVLVPGNHDGMAAYEGYVEGEPSGAYLGPDPKNAVAYDGLHHFRRTLGPLYFSFDWGKTRYLCTNTFELDRHDRLGYHAIVANWGGWMRPEQLQWLAAELADADARGQHKVVLMHHDPRGGSEGHHLGFYSDFRPFSYDAPADILLAYLRYLVHNVRCWQQEWMKRPGQPLAEHPVRKLVGLLLQHHVWAVVMGHDNENWVESYYGGEGVFTTDPEVRQYPAPTEPDVVDPQLVIDAADLLAAGDVEQASALLASKSPEEAHVVLEQAIQRLDAEGHFQPIQGFAPVEVQAWGLRAESPIHFVHVDDVGAYKYGREAHFESYGYVIAQLDEGRPVSLQRFDLRFEKAGPLTALEEG